MILHIKGAACSLPSVLSLIPVQEKGFPLLKTALGFLTAFQKTS